jgi:hypothetical protein
LSLFYFVALFYDVVLFVDVRTIWVISWVGQTLFFKALLVVLVKDVPGLLAALNSTDECSPGPFHGDVFFWIHYYMKIHA